jgi:ubiquinone/menaquinone biosynthesis C-methylase UbiE
MLHLLCCPVDRASLSGTLSSPALVCTSCGQKYPVTQGVVQFIGVSPSTRLSEPEKLNEMKTRDHAAADYDLRFTKLRNRLEIPPCLDALDPHQDDFVAELGCGTGRITLQYLTKVAGVVAMDFSLESLLILQKKIPEQLRSHCLLVQGDLSVPPIQHGAFHKVVSFQVFEHLPTAASRQQAFRTARDLLRTGGAMICSVYNWSATKKSLAQTGSGDNCLKEGFHRAGGANIYYYNFEEFEIRELIETSGLKVDYVHGLQMQLRGVSRLGPLAVLVNRVLAPTKYGVKNAHLMLARSTLPTH